MCLVNVVWIRSEVTHRYQVLLRNCLQSVKGVLPLRVDVFVVVGLDKDRVLEELVPLFTLLDNFVPLLLVIVFGSLQEKRNFLSIHLRLEKIN